MSLLNWYLYPILTLKFILHNYFNIHLQIKGQKINSSRKYIMSSKPIHRFWKMMNMNWSWRQKILKKCHQNGNFSGLLFFTHNFEFKIFSSGIFKHVEDNDKLILNNQNSSQIKIVIDE